MNATLLRLWLTLFLPAPLVQMPAPLQPPTGIATGTLVYVRTSPIEFRPPVVTAFTWVVETLVGSANAMPKETLESATRGTVAKTSCFKMDASSCVVMDASNCVAFHTTRYLPNLRGRDDVHYSNSCLLR
jgi:hypothetical protein